MSVEELPIPAPAPERDQRARVAPPTDGHTGPAPAPKGASKEAPPAPGTPGRARVAPARPGMGNGHGPVAPPRPLPPGTRRLPARSGYYASGRSRRGAKPLFVLRHHRPHYRRALAPSARKGGYIRTILAGLLGSTLLFLLVSLIGAGGVAWAAWSYFTDGLPSVTSLHPTEFQSTKIYDRHGGLLYEISDPTLGKRTYLGIEQLPPDLINATIAAEDASFRENAGVDLQSILRAVYINLSGQGTSGASTITMQLVRGAMLPEKDEPTFRRKVREAILANRVSETYSKDKILEIYLNDIYYGAQAYGVSAASQVYYGVAAKDLDLAQAAMLAGLPQAPSYYDPHTNYREAKIRQEYVLDQMVKSGYITQAEATKAAAEDVHPVPTVAEAGPSQAPHFVNYVRALLDNMYGPDMVNRGGLRVFTTIDLGFQELARRTAAAQVDALKNDQASNAAVVAINPRTGEIMAMLGSIDYANPDYGQVNVAVAPLQPGSAFKPFTYVTAFEKGYTPASMLPDIPLQFDGGANQPPYAPKDYDLQWRGPVSIRTALANSLNVPAVEMLREVGIPDVLQTARAMGITSLNQDPSAYGLSLTLGGANVSLLDMTSAYGTFANRGVHMPAVALLEVRDGAGNILYHFDPDKAKAVTAVTPQQAYLITDILSDNKARTPLFGADSAMKLSRPAAAKTGTTENYRDSWILGYTPDLVTGVWVGNNNGQPMAKVAGARGAGPIWHNFMEGVFADPELEKMLLQPDEAGPPINFPEPPGLHRVAVCAVSGMLPSAADTDLVNELFIAGTEPKQECDLHKMYKICLAQSTPMLANEDCPPQFVIDRPYLVLPPIYNDWAATQPKTLFPPTAICCFPTPVPTEPPTPDIQETPVPGLVPPIQIPNPVPRITPVRDDDLPGGVVNITAPRSGAGVGGQVTITGNAAATNFDYYTVEYGAGAAPANWVAINGQTTVSVRDGVLAIWNTNGLPEGPYTLRLTVANHQQQRRQYLVQVSIERTPLKVQLTAPTAGQPFLSGNQVALAATVNGPKDLAGVEFYVDNVRIAVDYDAPYQATWTATGGDHTLEAVAYSATGRRATSEPVQISVADPPTPTATPRPSFTILYPQDQASVNASTMNVLVAAGPGSGITRVDFYVDGWNVSTAQGQDTFQIQWQAIPGRHLIMAIGYNAGGTEVARTQVTVYTNPGP